MPTAGQSGRRNQELEMKRYPVNKRRDAQRFNRQASRTKAANVAPPPMRGGYRL